MLVSSLGQYPKVSKINPNTHPGFDLDDLTNYWKSPTFLSSPRFCKEQLPCSFIYMCSAMSSIRSFSLVTEFTTVRGHEPGAASFDTITHSILRNHISTHLGLTGTTLSRFYPCLSECAPAPTQPQLTMACSRFLYSVPSASTFTCSR